MAFGKILSKLAKTAKKKKSSTKGKIVVKKPSIKDLKMKTSPTKRKKAERVFKAPEARTKPSTRDIQTKVLNKAKKQGMTAKNFRMQNPTDKDVKLLYKANPNLKDKDILRKKGREYKKEYKKAKTMPEQLKVFGKKKLSDNAKFEKLSQIRDANARAFKVFNGFEREGKIVKGELEGLRKRFDRAGGAETLGMSFNKLKSVYKGPYYFSGL